MRTDPDDSGLVVATYQFVTKLLSIDGASKLATVMLLPFLGIYPTMVASGALTSYTAAAGLGTVVFGGAATLGIVTSELETSRVTGLKLVGVIGVPLLLLAVVSALLASTVQALLSTQLFSVLIAIVLFILAFDIASDQTPHWMPSMKLIGVTLCVFMLLDVTATIVGSGIQISMGGETAKGLVQQEAGWSLSIGQHRPIATATTSQVGKSLVAAVSGLALTIGAVVFRPLLVLYLDLARFRIGCGIALCLVGLNVAEVIATAPTLLVIVCSMWLAIDTEVFEGGC